MDPSKPMRSMPNMPTISIDPAFLAFVPILGPPPGQVSNFVDSPSRGYLVTIICSVVLALEILFYLLRMYSRIFVARKVRWDDLTCTIGFLLTIAFYVLCILAVRDAYVGHHLWNVSVAQYTNSKFFILQFLLELFNPVALAFIKLTFFLFYWQLFSIKVWTRYAILAGAFFSTVFYLIAFAYQLHIGIPNKGETLFAHSTKIANVEKLFVIPVAGFSVFFDLYILVLPIWSVMQLKLSLKRAVGVCAVFLTGGLACVCSIVSLFYRVRLNQTQDIFWILPVVLVTSLVEMQIGIICCCMPALPFLVRHQNAKNAANNSKHGSKKPIVGGSGGTGGTVGSGGGGMGRGLKEKWRGDQSVSISAGGNTMSNTRHGDEDFELRDRDIGQAV